MTANCVLFFLFSKIHTCHTAHEIFGDKPKTLSVNVEMPGMLAQYLSELVPIVAKPGCMEKALDGFVSYTFLKGFLKIFDEWKEERAVEFLLEIAKSNPEEGEKMIANMIETIKRYE